MAPSRHYVRHKVSALHFLENATSLVSTNGRSKLPLFVTGSWDQTGNVVTIHRYVVSSDYEIQSTRQATEYVDEVCSVKHKGDVTCIKSLNWHGEEMILVGSSLGSLTLYVVKDRTTSNEENGYTIQLDEISRPGWKSICKGSITDIDIFSETGCILAVSEDGKVIRLQIDQDLPLNVIECGCGLTSIQLLYCDTSFITAGSSPTGQLKIWDLKANPRMPVLSIEDSNPQAIYTCLALHPTYPKMIAVGSSTGEIFLWDSRNTTKPVHSCQVHTSSVYDLKFNPSHPEYLYSCAEDCTLRSWHWHQGKMAGDEQHPFVLPTSSNQETSHSTFFQGVLPLNCFQIYDNSGIGDDRFTFIAGSDAQYVVVEKVENSKRMVLLDEPICLNGGETPDGSWENASYTFFLTFRLEDFLVEMSKKSMAQKPH